MSIVPEAGDSYDIEHYREPALRLDAAMFARLHGAAFLLLSGDRAGLNVPDGPRQTVALDVRAEANDGWLPVRFQVWPVQKSDRSLIGRFISVGRTRRNDVVIPDVSLSKFHALFVEDDGTFSVQDARSRNGTYVDGGRVPAQGDGPPVPLRSGARLRLGAVDLTFLDAAGLQALVRDLRIGTADGR